ncbi:hypothetical protein StoSoilB22_38840 [Arthrobacter sp. StoSoilB22]|nr:hypothetical protein StoSoilB22_38840 [Arthrobacter sp. StoSoilB22]
MGVAVPVGVGVGVGVPVGVGAGGVVMVSEGGTSLGAGAGWVGAGLVAPGTAGTADEPADGTHTGSASETCGVGVDDGDTAPGASAIVAGWPASEEAVAPDAVDGVEAEGDDAVV